MRCARRASELHEGWGFVVPPRFLLVIGAQFGARASPRWPNSSASFAGETGRDGSWIAWRLAGGNNRELGRSAEVFPDLTGCNDALVTLRAGVDRAETLVAMDYRSAQWGWQLRLDTRLVAVSGRFFRRERECRYNLAQFMVAVAKARMPQEPLPNA